MLRRVEHTDSSDFWILVPQIEHARLSGALAQSWRDDSLAAIEPHAEFMAAIAHHDDGWADWDAAPDVDPSAGRPLSFVEMPLEASIDIWRRSIYLARSRGPLAAHVVSAHFTALLQKSSPKWSLDPARFQTSRQFLDDQSEHREQWLAEWQSVNPAVRTRKLAERALAYLQFFDGLSLWLCGALRSEVQTFQSPQGYEVSFLARGPLRFTVEPWPFVVQRVTWSVRGRRVPIGRYVTREIFASAPYELADLDFELSRDA